MDDVEKKEPYEAISNGKLDIDHEHEQLHKISPEDDARVRRKIDLVVLPMVCSVHQYSSKSRQADASRCVWYFSRSTWTSNLSPTLPSTAYSRISILPTQSIPGSRAPST